MTLPIRYFDYFFITRPILFLPGWATLIAGYLAASSRLNFIDQFLNGKFSSEIWNTTLFLGIVSFSFAMGGSFILNQLRDVSTDRKNNKLFLLGEGHVPIRHGYVESFLLLSISLITGFKIGYLFFVVLVVGLLMAYIYNLPPFDFKNKPIWGLFSNMAIGWLAFVIGWVLLEPINSVLIIGSLPYLFFNTGLYFLTTLPDIEGDAASHKITFAVKYGLAVTVWMSIFSFLVAVSLALFLNDQLILMTLVLFTPFVIGMIIYRSVSSAIMVVKTGIVSFCLVVSVELPFYLVVMMALLLFTRYYYKRRFQFEYPNLKGD